MIIFDLICEDQHHRFEGWFGSSADYSEQKEDGLVQCPVCGSKNIAKAAMAPNLGRKGNQEPVAVEQDNDQPAPEPAKSISTKASVPFQYQAMIGKLAKIQETLLADSEWVGDKFAKRARDMHYGDADEKPIHGTASTEEIADLADEGISALALPIPVLPPKSKN